MLPVVVALLFNFSLSWTMSPNPCRCCCCFCCGCCRRRCCRLVFAACVYAYVFHVSCYSYHSITASYHSHFISLASKMTDSASVSVQFKLQATPEQVGDSRGQAGRWLGVPHLLGFQIPARNKAHKATSAPTNPSHRRSSRCVALCGPNSQ